MLCVRLLLFFVLGTALDAGAGGDGRVPRLRTDDRVVGAAIARGRAQSVTFRRLVDRLDASDLIVHVTRVRLLHRPSGVTQFIAATPYNRYLRITVHADHASDAGRDGELDEVFRELDGHVVHPSGVVRR